MSDKPQFSSDALFGALTVTAGGGVLTFALFPLALPILLLTAVAVLPLAVLAIALALIAAPVALLARALTRRRARARAPESPADARGALGARRPAPRAATSSSS